VYIGKWATESSFKQYLDEYEPLLCDDGQRQEDLTERGQLDDPLDEIDNDSVDEIEEFPETDGEAESGDGLQRGGEEKGGTERVEETPPAEMADDTQEQ